MPDQATARPTVSPPVMTDEPGSGTDMVAGARVIPLDARRRRPSPAQLAAARTVHPAQLWADRRMMGLEGLARPS